MAATYTGLSLNRVGINKQVSGTFTFDTSYPTGGLAFSPALVGLYSIQSLEVEAGFGGYLAVWDKSTSAPKVILYQGDNANASPAPGVQVPNTTNVATVTVTFIATGK